MTNADKRRHKKLIKKYGQFIDAYNSYNKKASQQEQININSEISRIPEKLFKPCEALKKMNGECK